MKTLLILSLIIGLSACGLEDDTRQKVNTRHANADIMTLAGLNGCTACHQVKTSLIGPSWERVSDRYKNKPGAREYLIDRVKNGSSGAWTDTTGGSAMPPNSPRVSDDHIIKLVDFILSISQNEGKLILRPENKAQ